MNKAAGPGKAGHYVLVILLGAAAVSAAPSTQTFKGVVTDDNCFKGDHSHMRMGDTDGECAVACVNAHGSSYMLFDGKTAYTLSDQKAPEKLAGQKVIVVGTLDAKAKTIQVSSIAPQK